MASPVKIEDVNHKHFQKAKGDNFLLRVGLRDVKVKLVEVTPHGKRTAPDSTRDPFSLVFRMPKRETAEAGVHLLQHRRFEPMELLMTPLASDGGGDYLEVVFG